MAKRPTIGRNPLDTLVAESHLDTVVPDLVTGPSRSEAPPKPGATGDLQSLLAENQTLQKEVEKLKAQVQELKERLAQVEPRWVTLRRLGEK